MAGDYGPGVSTATYTIEDRTVVLPVQVRDASAAFATFLVPAAAVRRLMPPGLKPAQPFPGRALCTIVGVDYREGDLGQYHEVGVCFLLKSPTSRLDLLAMARNRAPAYIHRLPVTTTFSCEAGRHIWGYPKDVMDIDVDDTPTSRIVTLRDGDQLVLRMTTPRGGSRHFDEVEVDSVGAWGGTVRFTPSRMAGEGVKAGFRAGELVLGSHPIADELRGLGLPKKPLVAGSIERFTGSFGAARVEPATG
jgi:hypothetical protein